MTKVGFALDVAKLFAGIQGQFLTKKIEEININSYLFRGKEAKLTKESHNRNIKPRNKKKKESVNPNNSSDPL